MDYLTTPSPTIKETKSDTKTGRVHWQMKQFDHLKESQKARGKSLTSNMISKSLVKAVLPWYDEVPNGCDGAMIVCFRTSHCLVTQRLTQTQYLPTFYPAKGTNTALTVR